jgi:hypothetical protein
MSDVDKQFQDDPAETIPSEIETLKARATQMNIQFHPAIGVEKLKAKINAKLGIEEDVDDSPEDAPAEPKAKAAAASKPKKSLKQLQQERNIRDRKLANRLIRVVVNCMNPNKKDWEGEIFTVGNAVVGTIKKYVPFNVEAGYHVPHMIYEQMVERKYQAFTKKKSKIPGQPDKMEGKLVPEFNVQVLPKLSMDELKELARKQAMNHSIDK